MNRAAKLQLALRAQCKPVSLVRHSTSTFVASAEERGANYSGERMVTRVVTGLIASLGLSIAAMAAEIKVLAPNAAKASVTEAISVFEKASGHTVSVSWLGTEAITKRVADGEAVDVVVNAARNIDRQSKDGRLAAATRTDFAKAQISDYLAGGDADVGFQHINELLHAKGINYLGPLPADLQNHTDHLPQQFGQINSLAAENATDGTSATNPNARHSPFVSGATGQGV
ncbi:MAG: hypothetical protein CFE43_21560 [Burkholderiales bacterium PBB3]|nr:MAG: hypothetical protein CFE43_21560 [Burkholderiales bacterium PBB3]